MHLVVALGYVGLPRRRAGTAFNTTGLNINAVRIAEIQRHHDHTNEITPERLAKTTLRLASDPASVSPADIYIVTVPTPVDAANRPICRMTCSPEFMPLVS